MDCVSQEEQEEITRSKDGKSLTWADTKRMPLTSRVIQETMRVASVLSFTFREAVEDVEYEGELASSLPPCSHTHRFRMVSICTSLSRVSDSQGMEGVATLQKHSPQPGKLQRPRKVRSLQIRGRKRRTALPCLDRSTDE